MGEIAEAMIEGDRLCGGCGVFLEWADGPGFPLYCSRDCAPDDETWAISRDYRSAAVIAAKTERCSCGRSFATSQALADHRRAKGHE